jgi:hypothetical protein
MTIEQLANEDNMYKFNIVDTAHGIAFYTAHGTISADATGASVFVEMRRDALDDLIVALVVHRELQGPNDIQGQHLDDVGADTESNYRNAIRGH